MQPKFPQATVSGVLALPHIPTWPSRTRSDLRYRTSASASSPVENSSAAMLFCAAAQSRWSSPSTFSRKDRARRYMTLASSVCPIECKTPARQLVVEATSLNAIIRPCEMPEDRPSWHRHRPTRNTYLGPCGTLYSIQSQRRKGLNNLWSAPKTFSSIFSARLYNFTAISWPSRLACSHTCH